MIVSFLYFFCTVIALIFAFLFAYSLTVKLAVPVLNKGANDKPIGVIVVYATFGALVSCVVSFFLIAVIETVFETVEVA